MMPAWGSAEHSRLNIAKDVGNMAREMADWQRRWAVDRVGGTAAAGLNAGNRSEMPVPGRQAQLEPEWEHHDEVVSQER